jgi:serine protease AprX
MKRLAFIAIVLLPAFVLGQVPVQHWIQFTDKDNTPFDVLEPLEFLSQRALDRRQRQNIPILENDLPVDPTYIQAVLDEGAIYLTHSKWFNSVTVIVPNQAMLTTIQNLPFVLSSEPVGKKDGYKETINKFEFVEAEKSLTESQFNESNYGLGFNQIDMLGGISLHNQGFKGQGMLIAVLDGGFPNVDVFPAFDSLRANNRLVGGWDFVARDNSIYGDASHGMSVLSTMAANLPGEFVGTAPEASYLLFRTEDTSSELPVELDYWIAAAEFADSAGADIINSSLGYTTFDNSDFDFSYSDMDGNTTRGTRGADIAASKGILVVNSAGNSGNNSWKYIGAPSDGDSVLAIGAVTSEGLIANFSSEGPSSDNDIKPNVCAQGQGITYISSGGAVSAGGNGTSFSGPIIAGMAACLWQIHKDSLTNMEIFHAIEASAHKFRNPDGFYGYGIPNFAKANLMLSGIDPDNVDESELFEISPNPFANQISGTFYSSSNQDVVIRLVNSLGQEVRRFERATNDFTAVEFTFSGLQSLTQGMYMLHIESDCGKYYQKMVKLRE